MPALWGGKEAARSNTSLGKVIKLTQGDAAPLWLTCKQTPTWRDAPDPLDWAGPPGSARVLNGGQPQEGPLCLLCLRHPMKGSELWVTGDWISYSVPVSLSLSFPEPRAKGGHPLCSSMPAYSPCHLQLRRRDYHLECHLRAHAVQAEYPQPL